MPGSDGLSLAHTMRFSSFVGRRDDENRMVWAHQRRPSSVDFTNATVVGPIRKSNRSNCRRMVWAGQRQPSHQPTDHRPITVKAFSWRIADTNSWPIFRENGEGRRWGLVEWRNWACPVWCDGLWRYYYWISKIKTFVKTNLSLDHVLVSCSKLNIIY